MFSLFINTIFASNLAKVDSTTKEANFIFDLEEKTLKIRLYTWNKHIKFDEFNFLGVFMRNEELPIMDDAMMDTDNTPFSLIICYNNDAKQHLSTSLNNAMDTLQSSFPGRIIIKHISIDKNLVDKPIYCKYYVDLLFKLNKTYMDMFLSTDIPCTFTILYSTEGISSYCSGKIYRRDFLVLSKKWFFNLENFTLIYVICTFPFIFRQNIIKLMQDNKAMNVEQKRNSNTRRIT